VENQKKKVFNRAKEDQNGEKSKEKGLHQANEEDPKQEKRKSSYTVLLA